MLTIENVMDVQRVEIAKERGCIRKYSNVGAATGPTDDLTTCFVVNDTETQNSPPLWCVPFEYRQLLQLF